MKLDKNLLVFSSIAAAVAIAVSGCSSTATRTASAPDSSTSGAPPMKGGGYYKDDGPGANPPPDLDSIPNAAPKPEPLHAFANNPYKVLGKNYTPQPAEQAYRTTGLASWYGRKFHGKPTSSGEIYDMYGMTAAHKTLPIPSFVRVTNVDNGRNVVLRVNDRGPFHDDRIIDLSYTAAHKLDLLKGVGMVEVEMLDPESDPNSFAARVAENSPTRITAPVAAVAQPAPVAPASAPALVATPASPPNAISVSALPALAAPQTPPVQPVTTVVAAQSATPASGPVLYLQLGAFSKSSAADDLAARLTAKLGRAIPGVLQIPVNGLIKVQAGPFLTATEAELAATRITDEFGIKPYRVTGAPPSQALAAAAPTLTSGLFLQLAAVSSEDAANALIARVGQSQSNLPGFAKIENNGLIKVQTGPFTTLAHADLAAQSLQSLLGVKPYRVQR